MALGRISCSVIQNVSSYTCFTSIRSLGTSLTRLEKKRKKEQWNFYRKDPDHVPKGEWSSFYSYFTDNSRGMSLKLLHLLQRPIDFSPKKIHEWYRKKMNENDMIDQKFRPERLMAVGSELAAAHFVVFRGGRIRAKGSDQWIEKDEDDNYDLPSHYRADFCIVALDASGTSLRYEGFENLNGLQHLQWLNLSNCVNINDWCLDRVCGQHSSTIEYLNISNCTNVTGLGITALARLRKLRTLDITGLHNIENIQLLCLMLEDVNPYLEIIGVDYMELPDQDEKTVA